MKKAVLTNKLSWEWLVVSVLSLSVLALGARSFHPFVYFLFLILLFSAAIINFLDLGRLAKWVQEMRRAAERLAAGDLEHRFYTSERGDLGAATVALNRAAHRAKKRVNRLLSKELEERSVLSSMLEGVISFDSEGNVIHFNPAAARMLGIGDADISSRAVEEVIRNPRLQHFIRQTLAGEAEEEMELIFWEGEEKSLRVYGRPLNGRFEGEKGVLIVLNDITNLRRLENLRRDFVANVSHELRTPITAIKGFVETLLDGAVDKPEEARHFVGIIERQVNRLNAIFNDLLTLSSIERRSERSEIELQPDDVSEVIEAAAAAREAEAAEKRCEIRIECEKELPAQVNSGLLEQALINLLDNAIRYSPPGQAIEVRGALEGEEVVVRVEDHGSGIESKHLPRLFERFYRVDKARSRTEGGTGLGLAIVKHIVQAHGGSIAVESTVGKGSTFTIRLPKKAAKQEADSRVSGKELGA